jgi:hypothetical protein
MAASYKYKNIRKGEEQPIAVFDVFNDGTSYVDEMSLDMVEDEYDILNAAFKAATDDKKKASIEKKRRQFSTAMYALRGAGAKRTTPKEEFEDTSSTSVEGAVKQIQTLTASSQPTKDPHAPKEDGTSTESRSDLVKKHYDKKLSLP